MRDVGSGTVLLTGSILMSPEVEQTHRFFSPVGLARSRCRGVDGGPLSC